MYLLIYVDDIIIVSSVPSVIDELLQRLCLDFAVKDLGNLHYFLGVEVLSIKDGILLSQQRYIRDLLHKTNMEDAKPVTTPMSSSSVCQHSRVILWRTHLYTAAPLDLYNTCPLLVQTWRLLSIVFANSCIDRQNSIGKLSRGSFGISRIPSLTGCY